MVSSDLRSDLASVSIPSPFPVALWAAIPAGLFESDPAVGSLDRLDIVVDGLVKEVDAVEAVYPIEEEESLASSRVQDSVEAQDPQDGQGGGRCA